MVPRLRVGRRDASHRDEPAVTAQWHPYPRRLWHDPVDLDADIRNGMWARRQRAYAMSVEAFWEQQRPVLGRHNPAFAHHMTAPGKAA